MIPVTYTVCNWGKWSLCSVLIQESFEFKKPTKPASRGAAHIQSRDGKGVPRPRQNSSPVQVVSVSPHALHPLSVGERNSIGVLRQSCSSPSLCQTEQLAHLPERKVWLRGGRKCEMRIVLQSVEVELLQV